MALVHRAQRKPRRIDGIEWSDPLTADLVCALPMTTVGPAAMNLVGRNRQLLYTNDGPVAGGWNYAVRSDFDNWYNQLTTGYTFMLWHEGCNLGSWSSILALYDSTAANRNVTWQQHSTNGYVRIYHGTAYRNMSGLTTADWQTPQVMTLCWQPSICYYYQDGELDAQEAHATPPATGLNATLYFGGATSAVYAMLAWRRYLSAGEIERVSFDPWAPYRIAGPVAVRIVAGLDTGGTVHGLAGHIAGTSDIAGALTIVRSLTGSLASSSGVSTTLGVTRSLTGSIAAQSNVTGALTIQGQVSLAGDVAAQTTTSGALTTTKPLTGGLAGSSSVSAALGITTSPIGSIAARSDVTASLAVVHSLAGDVASQTDVSGTLRVARPLAGVVTATTQLLGGLRISFAAPVELAGHIQAQAMLVAVLRIFRGLTGQAAVLATTMAADADAVLDDLPAESAVYQPAGGDIRSIQVVVDRQTSHLADTPRRHVQPLRVWAKNDATAGIGSAEVTKQDTITVARHIGAEPVPMRVVRRLSQSDGWTELELL